MSMTKSDIDTLIRAAALAASVVTPVAGWVYEALAFAAAQAQLAHREGNLTDAEMDEILARAKADRLVADARWDEVVRKAKEQT